MKLARVLLKPGRIYILRNPYHRDAVVKVGRTGATSESRAAEISKGTGVPYPFEVLYEEGVIDSELAERLIHDALRDYRFNRRREFFHVPLKIAVRAVFETCLTVNGAVITERSRLVLVAGRDSPGARIRDQLEPRRGGTTRVSIMYENEGAVARIDLADRWMIHCSARFVEELKRLPWLKDVFLLSLPPETVSEGDLIPF